MPSHVQDPVPLDFDRLLPDAVAVGLREQSWPAFHAWLSKSLGRYAAQDLDLLAAPELRRALGFALARALWNALPLPRTGFVPEPVPEPGRNEPCPCGSGQKYKRCCERAPPLGAAFAPAMLWPIVLLALEPPERRAALASHHAPRIAIAAYAREALDAGRAAEVIDLLAPEFEAQPRHTDDIAAAMLLTLCDALEERRDGAKRKRALLERIARIPVRSPLRSDACQRLACIEMDRRRPEQAWQLFRQAQQDNPKDPALGMLEVQLLLGEGKSELARERARFHLGQLRRRGADVEPRLLQFYEAMAQDPGRALAEVAMDVEGGAGERLGAWLDRVAQRPVPAYRLVELAPEPPADRSQALRERLRQMGVRGAELDRVVADMERKIAAMESAPVAECAAAEPEAAEPETAAPEAARVLAAPAALDALAEPWREVFTLDKPFSVHPLPFDGAGIWDEDVEEGWSDFLDEHPEAFDSLDILDDLATAVMLHPQGDQPSMHERLLEPLLARAVAILEAAVAAVGDVELPWPATEHRPALRALYRLAELEDARGHAPAAVKLRERLLRLNPGDNHGVRYLLSTHYAQHGGDAACIDLAARYPEDVAPELRYNEALARYRLGQARSATAALERAHREAPRVARFLIPGRVRKPKLDAHGVSLDGDDSAWLYREAMRATWQATPGALEWVRKVVGGG